MFDFISMPLGWIFEKLSDVFGGNFALSVLIFTILVNLVMLPLSIKSQHSMSKQARLKPKLDALKKKCGDDKRKYNQEMSELYSREGVSMTGGGCLPMIVRLVFMMGVYWVIMSPMTYVIGIDATAISQAKYATQYVKTASADASQGDVSIYEVYDYNKENLDSYVASNYDFAMKTEDGKTTKFYLSGKEKSEAVTSSDVNAMREFEIVPYLNDDKAPAQNLIVKNEFLTNGGKIEDVNKYSFNLFGIDLTATPKFSWNFSNAQIAWLIPLISFATSMLSSVVSSMIQRRLNPDAPNMMMMMLLMPFMSLWFAFQFPCAVGFYWACSNLIAGGVQSGVQLIYNANKVIAGEQAKDIIARAKKEEAAIASSQTAE